MKIKQTNNLPYAIYARKSSESEDRQVLSIESQLNELRDLAARKNLRVTEVFTESQSAKTIGRETFNRLIASVVRNKYEGIICWKLDRLARNPIDGAQLIHNIEMGNLDRIVTPGQTYTNSTNDKFSMSIELCLAKRYVDDLSDNVRRGNRSKLEKGWLPGSAPLGYLNDRESRTIVKDPERFDLVYKIWEMVLTETRTVPRILEIINRHYGFRTRKTKRTGNRPLSRNGIYKLLANPFYYGVIFRKGEYFHGAHVPMITKQEFDKVQRYLSRPGKMKPKRKYFPFTGLIQCGECGSMITAEEKTNRFGTKYVYYHCSKRNQYLRCGQKYIRAEDLHAQLAEIINYYSIHDDFRDWAIKKLKQMHGREMQKMKQVKLCNQKAYENFEIKLNKLIDLKLDDLITVDEYLAMKNKLLGEMMVLKEKREDLEHNYLSWFEQSENAFNFANKAHIWFELGTPNQKREIISCLGSKFVLKNKILRIEAKKPFLIIKEGRDKKDWYTTVDYVRTFFTENRYSWQNHK